MEILLRLCDLYQFTCLVLDLCFDFVKYKFQRSNKPPNEIDISGKCVVVTGGSRGIGKSCAREFARRGAVVVIGNKNVRNGRATVEEIRRDTGNMNVTFVKLDLADMDSVEKFAKKVATDHPKIKILLNNAAIAVSQDDNVKTKDGLNIHVAVNYMGHFLLTHLLMDNLKAETNPRIVSMLSTFLLMSQLNIDNLNMDGARFGLQNYVPYSNTKCMLALFTKELGKLNGINAYALCPGVVNTGIFDDSPLLIRLLLQVLFHFTTHPDMAASDFVLHCALEESLGNESGKSYRFRKHFDKANKIVDVHSERHLYDVSAKLVNLRTRLERVTKVI